MKRKIIIIVSFILFIVFLSLYLFNKVNYIDTFIYNIIISLRSTNMTKFMKIITFFASTKFIIFIMLILLFLSLLKGKIPIIINVLVVIEALLNRIIKTIIKRDRPKEISMVKETSYSFPSGHVMVSVVLYGFLIYLIYKSKLNYVLKIIFITILVILITLIFISRIYLGVHYFSDCIAGACLGIVYLLIMLNILERKKIL